MRIGIIGAGKIGSTLAHLFVDAGHDVAVANSRGPDTLRDLESDLGEHGHAATVEEAARYGEIVVVTIPFGHYRDVPADDLAGKTVIDTANYYPELDGHLAELDEGRTTSSELMQQHLGDAHVVKAFNAMRFDHLREFGREGGANHRYGIPVAGDDPAAKRQVFDLVEQIGYEPVDAGRLADGRKFQPRTAVYTADLWAGDLRERIGIDAA
ncbi:NADPH-dependent F420 reductase [Actinoplanes sp. M2I2]|uniref:NADPH-dependent F420 reductase n=1 Tax=Actinoplanes sp. M2I2 TaxID=1734444 RepID=UPI0020218AC2|nr:NAD(P)-binding domain-containing protein [Actinoplanes sp. M2I2]